MTGDCTASHHPLLSIEYLPCPSAQVFGVLVAIKRLKDGAVAWEAKQYASETELLVSVDSPLPSSH